MYVLDKEILLRQLQLNQSDSIELQVRGSVEAYQGSVGFSAKAP